MTELLEQWRVANKMADYLQACGDVPGYMENYKILGKIEAQLKEVGL